MKNLGEKLTDLKNEFYQTKNEKVNEQTKIKDELEDLKNQLTKTSSVKNLNSLNEKIKKKTEEGEKLTEEIAKLGLNCKKKETLFNKYIILLRSKCVKTEEESYITNNPCLILENNFEEELKHEMIKALSKEKSYLTEEDLKKYEGTIDIYFRDLFERERTCQLILLQRSKVENKLKEHQDEINQIVDKIMETENEIKLKKMRFSEVNKNLKALQQKIETRNRTLKFNLENLSESNFMDYLNANDNVLKSMKKIYGNKILSKVFKAQKEKFFENVMLDHSFKKSKINEFVKLTSQYEKTILDYEQNKEVLLNSYNSYCRELSDVRKKIEIKKKEKEGLLSAKNELISNVETMLVSEMEEITNEKIKLRQKLNCDYYFVKVKEVAGKIENLKKEREKILKEFYQFRNVIIDREEKLYREDFDNKQKLLTSDDPGDIGSEMMSMSGILTPMDTKEIRPVSNKKEDEQEILSDEGKEENQKENYEAYENIDSGDNNDEQMADIEMEEEDSQQIEPIKETSNFLTQ